MWSSHFPLVSDRPAFRKSGNCYRTERGCLFLGIWECQSYHGNDRSSYSDKASWFGWFFFEHFMAKHSLADNRDAKQCNKRINKTQFVGAPNGWSAFPSKMGMTFGTTCLLGWHLDLYKFGPMVRWLRHKGIIVHDNPVHEEYRPTEVPWIYMFIVFWKRITSWCWGGQWKLASCGTWFTRVPLKRS